MRFASLMVAMLLVAASAAVGAAAERPLAALVPGDVSTYSEVNLDRALGRAPETAAIGQAFAQMKSPELIRQMWGELAAGDKDMAKISDVLEMLKAASDVVGPRLGWATWVPDTQSLMGGMTGEGANPLSMAPKVLMVADVRDAARLDALITQVAAETGLGVRVTESAGTKTMSFANGMVDLIRGSDWLAIGFPPESARQAADRASGAGSDSLSMDAGYQGVMARLPADAAVTEYVSGPAVRQLVALANMMAPSAGIPTPEDRPLGVAMGMRVEERGGSQMATVYYTADLETIRYLIDAPLALQATIVKPMLEQQKGRAEDEAAADECLGHLEEIAGAMLAYLDDHDDKFPAAARWVDELKPYLGDESVLKCPDDKSDARCSYGMNSALGGKSVDDLEDPSSVVLLYETAHPGANPTGGKEDVASPPRHSRGDNFAYADGAAEWVAPDVEEQPRFEAKPGGAEA